jgi:hypothetical protein
MVESIRLESLIRVLPRTIDELQAESETELHCEPRANSLFIPPPLREIHPVQPGTSIVLIEARAAVGKSMLARHLAHVSRGLYWDMSEIHVGHGTLYGRIAQTFGMKTLGSIIAQLMSGEMLLVIDAVDEAELRAVGAAFDAFLSDLKQLVVAPRPMPTVVVLGRSETIEYISMFLGSGVRTARLVIESFDGPSALDFIDVRLDEHAAISSIVGQHQRHRVVYERARVLLLKVLERSLVSDARSWSWDELSPTEVNWQSDRVREFLGYAPVLESLSDYLAPDSTLTQSRGENFYNKMITECLAILREPALGVSSHWDLLGKMVRDLLLREQGKFVKQARESMPGNDNANWDGLYSPEEQLIHILSRMAGMPPAVVLPEGFSDAALEQYHSLLQSAVPNHPFVGASSTFVNVVMRDYTYAWELSRNDPGLADYVRDAMQDDAYLPTPMFGRFYIALTTATSGIPDCDASDVGFVYESLVAEYMIEDRPLLLIGDGEESETGLFVLGGKSMDAGLVLLIREPSKGIQLWRRLTNARIVGTMPVRTGVRGSSFTIGPDAQIDCSLLEIPVAFFRVQTSQDSTVRIIASIGYLDTSTPRDLVIALHDEGTFGVFWENMRYPWVQYAIERPDIDVDESRLMQSFVYFCRTVTRFGEFRRRAWGQHGAADWTISRNVDILYRYGGGALTGANELHDFLTKEGLLSIHGDQVSLDIQWLQERGINKLDLFQRKLSPQIRELLELFERQRDS